MLIFKKVLRFVIGIGGADPIDPCPHDIALLILLVSSLYNNKIKYEKQDCYLDIDVQPICP